MRNLLSAALFVAIVAVVSWLVVRSSDEEAQQDISAESRATGERIALSGLLRDDLECSLIGQLEGRVVDPDIWECRGEITFEAGRPFVVRHGFIVEEAGPTAPEMLDTGTEFVLKVDGDRPDHHLWLQDHLPAVDAPVLWWEYSFPDGLSGDHSFEAEWVWEGDTNASSSSVEITFLDGG